MTLEVNSSDVLVSNDVEAKCKVTTQKHIVGGTFIWTKVGNLVNDSSLITSDASNETEKLSTMLVRNVSLMDNGT